MAEIAAGTFFEDYYLIALLGEGGMSEVFLAYDIVRARIVALKYLLGLHAENPKAIARMRREGEIYRTLNHPSVVRVLDIGQAEEAPIYLVLELLRGKPIDEVMADRRERLPVPRAVRILEDCASALNDAHRKGIIHRDVKPQNVILGPDGRATLVDFGIAHADDDLVETGTGQVIGTLLYAAPEQRRGDPSDHRADVWALGATVYEALTGQRVVTQGTYQEMLDARTADLPPPSAVNPEVPETLDRVVMKLLADDADDRYQSLRDLLIELGLFRVQLEEAERTAMFGDAGERALDEATKAYREHDLDRARELVQELQANPPEELRAELCHLQGLVASAASQPMEALRCFQEARELDPVNEEVVVDLSLELIRIGQVERAGLVLAKMPSYIRGHLVVRCIMDLIQSLPDVPERLFARFSDTGLVSSFHRAVKEMK